MQQTLKHCAEMLSVTAGCVRRSGIKAAFAWLLSPRRLLGWGTIAQALPAWTKP